MHSRSAHAVGPSNDAAPLTRPREILEIIVCTELASFVSTFPFAPWVGDGHRAILLVGTLNPTVVEHAERDIRIGRRSGSLSWLTMALGDPANL